MPRPASPAASWSPGWAIPAGLLVLAAAVRALRFWGRFASWAHEDESRVAIPALQILDGTFPVHHVGVEYHGAAPAYPLAAWFAVAGTSTLALDVFCWAVGVGVAWTGYLLARRVLPPPAACAALLLLAVPPLLLARWGISGNLNYPLTLLIGNLVLLGTHTVFFRRRGRPVPLLALGLVAGLGWWTNPLVVVYCGPFAALALRTGLWRRAAFWGFPAGVLLGGLPDWIYEIVHFPSARLVLHESGSLPPESVAERGAMLVGDVALQLLGAQSRPEELVPPWAVQAAVTGLGVLAVVRAIVRDRGEVAWLLGARAGRGSGLGALWMVPVLNVGLVLATKRTLGVFYLLPLYGVLPVWLGELLVWLWRRRRPLGAAALAGLVGFHLWANWHVTLGRERALVRWTRLHELARPVSQWLEARGIRHVYWAPAARLSSFEFTYLTGGRVLGAHVWGEPVLAHAHAVDARLAPPIVTTPGRLPALRGALGVLAVPARETRVGGFVVLEPAVPPRGFAVLPATGWTASASHREHEAGHLVDRDAGTAWSTGQDQAPGQWLAVDLGREEEVARVDLLVADWREVPAGFRVDWSADGRTWRPAAAAAEYWGPLFVSGPHPFLRTRRGRIQAVFEPVRARFLRVVTTGRAGGRAWSARELLAYRPAPPAPAPPGEGELAAALRREGVTFAYASAWQSARIRVEGRGRIGALESNMNLNSYGRLEPDPTWLEPFRPAAGRAVLLGPDADGAGVRRMLAARGALARETTAGPYPLLLLGPEAARPRLPRGPWHAGASVSASAAARAVDGDRRTRWLAPGPIGAEAHFSVDLGEPQRVGGVRLRPGSGEGGPADFTLEGSLDGRSWRVLGPHDWAGPLYWTGAELLRNSQPEWAVRVPPVAARHLRLRPAAPGRIWAIEELELLE